MARSDIHFDMQCVRVLVGWHGHAEQAAGIGGHGHGAVGGDGHDMVVGLSLALEDGVRDAGRSGVVLDGLGVDQGLGVDHGLDVGADQGLLDVAGDGPAGSIVVDQLRVSLSADGDGKGELQTKRKGVINPEVSIFLKSRLTMTRNFMLLMMGV